MTTWGVHQRLSSTCLPQVDGSFMLSISPVSSNSSTCTLDLSSSLFRAWPLCTYAFVTFCNMHLGHICAFHTEVHACITSTVSHRRDATCLEAYLFLYWLQLKSKLGPWLDACLIISQQFFFYRFATASLARIASSSIVACVQFSET